MFTPTQLEESKEIVDRCTVRLMRLYSFWGCMLLSMDFTPTNTTPTMATNGVQLFYNPEYVLGAEEEIICTDLAHEIGHKAFLDCWRRGNRDPKIWNYATDYRINIYLKDSGFKLGDDYLYSAKFIGMDAEEIYDDLISNPDSPEMKQAQQKGSGCGCGGLMDHPTTQGQEQPADKQADLADSGIAPSGAMQLTEAEARIEVAQAVQFAKMHGNLPGALAKYADELINPKMRWQDIVQQFMEECDADDYSWHHPVRHMLAYNCYLPTLHGEGTKCFAISVDTSASTASFIAKFLAEISVLAKVLNFEKLYVLWCDTQVFRVDEYDRGDLPIVKPDHLQQGGTSLVPPFEWLAERHIEPRGMCYLTDTHGPFPESPDYPVLWAHANKDASAPFGELVDIS